ncbi:MAG: oligosaccharide flippase family protein [Lachnospiraceae bacterium]|nr:oligosaccharide flippase family protein [Lachnospiraceae bacterium]
MDDLSKPDLKKNFIYRLIYEILLYAIPVIALPYVSRVIGADGVGEYSYTYSVISYFMMFGALGTVSYGTREIARKRDDKAAYTKAFFEIELLSVFICLLCLLLWIALILYSVKYRLLFLALTPFLIGTMLDISWFYVGLERIGTLTLTGMSVRIAGLVLLFALVRSKEDLVTYCLINSVTLLGANLAMWIALPKYLGRTDLKGLRFRHHFRESLVYFVPTIAVSIYLVLDKTLIGLITEDPYQNGYYEQASRITGIAKSLAFVIYNTVATARLSYLFAEEKYDEAKDRIRSSLDFILLLSFGSAFGLLGIAKTFVPVFLGDGYEPVTYLLYLMLPLIPVIAVSNCLGSLYYVPAGKRGKSAGYIVAGAVLNLLLNLCLIPFLGATGAVIASLAAEFVITVLYVKNCDGFLQARAIGAFSVKRILAGLFMALAVYLLAYLPIPRIFVLFVQIPAGAVLYVLLLYVSGDGLVRDLTRRISTQIGLRSKDEE